jgi:uncharacterized protein (DUF302 family)
MRKIILTLGMSVILLFSTFGQSTNNPTGNKTNKKTEAMFLEDESKFGFEETIEKLKSEVEKKTWKLSAVHDLQETLKKSNYEVLPVKVFAICHPKHSSRILSKDDERIVSSLMPCRVSVYQKSNGKTYISRMNAGLLAKSIGGIIEEVMVASAADVEEILLPLVKE